MDVGRNCVLGSCVKQQQQPATATKTLLVPPSPPWPAPITLLSPNDVIIFGVMFSTLFSKNDRRLLLMEKEIIG